MGYNENRNDFCKNQIACTTCERFEIKKSVGKKYGTEALDVLEENDIDFPDDMSAGNFFLENTIICPDCGSVDVVENSDGSYTCQTCGRVFIV